MNREEELLVITMEECGELIQACSKVIRSKHQKKYLKNLKEEIGDVVLMIHLLIHHGYVTEDFVEQRMDEKRKKLEKWSKLFDEES